MKILRLFVVFTLICSALSPRAQAVVPAPDGGYPNFTTAEGDNALKALTTGIWNTAVGTFSLFSVSTGNFNTAVGAGSLALNTGDSNTATGAAALLFNTLGAQNTAVGTAALESNSYGNFNTATGAFALFNNYESSNTANGAYALLSNTGGFANTANGANALESNTFGDNNTANGVNALQSNTTGYVNTANGSHALELNLTGDNNTANGGSALLSNRLGSSNTADGHFALSSNYDGDNNTANGAYALEMMGAGSGNIAMGFFAGCALLSGDNNIIIGNSGVDSESNTIRIGTVVAGMNCFVLQQAAHTATYIAGISGTAVVGDTVVVDENGQLGTATSSQRFKKAIRPMDKTSEAILALKPVSFQYKSDSKGTLRFGLIAEDVAKVNPELVVRDRDGEIYSVRYDAVNAMLLNEFLKENRIVQEQKAIVAQLKQDFQSRLAEQQKQIEALTAGLQKVSAQIEASKPAPQMVNNNQ